MENFFLNQTITCEKCKGKGLKEDGKSLCEICNGSGAVIDNGVPNIIKKHIPEIPRAILPKIMDDIYKHFENKLADSYNRGVTDGKSYPQEEEKEVANKL